MAIQHSQQLLHHPTNTMAKTRSGGTVPKPSRSGTSGSDSRRGGSKSDGSRTHESDAEQSDSEDKDQKIREMRMTIFRMQQRQKASLGTNGYRRPKKVKEEKGTESALQNLVYQTAKTDLFKICKFLSTEEHLLKATRKVMSWLDLT